MTVRRLWTAGRPARRGAARCWRQCVSVSGSGHSRTLRRAQRALPVEQSSQFGPVGGAMERDRRRRREDERRSAGSSVSLSSSSMAIKLWKCYQSRVTSGDRQDDDFVFDDIFEMLDADLQPVKPDPDCPDSRRVFENHKKLAKDYLKLQTEVTLLNTKKKQLEDRLHRTATERHSRDTPKYVSDLVKLQEENENLRKLHRKLMAERDQLTRPRSDQLSDDWSVLSG